ncbi:hypothetical protein RHGRI_007771 [Rhododendron griersonianum]|uniref:Uncharacterized protein n=1 Tax=Rhododendron griersonianum TaxID=479676 RepID=A0AAV6KYS3_9ERIC|nr:hypothetical protein RHGRI_007771 [Rhododendron griersonianum]
MCNICHVFGHHTSKCARGASSSSPPQQLADQVWTRVGNGKQKVGCEQPETEQLNYTVAVHASIVPQQLKNPIVSPVPEEEVTDSEKELLEVLEGVVSSSQRAEPIAPQEKGSTKLHVQIVYRILRLRKRQVLLTSPPLPHLHCPNQLLRKLPKELQNSKIKNPLILWSYRMLNLQREVPTKLVKVGGRRAFLRALPISQGSNSLS